MLVHMERKHNGLVNPIYNSKRTSSHSVLADLAFIEKEIPPDQFCEESTTFPPFTGSNCHAKNNQFSYINNDPINRGLAFKESEG